MMMLLESVVTTETFCHCCGRPCPEGEVAYECQGCLRIVAKECVQTLVGGDVDPLVCICVDCRPEAA